MTVSDGLRQLQVHLAAFTARNPSSAGVPDFGRRIEDLSGLWDDRTANALASAQSQLGLPVTGQPDLATVTALDQAITEAPAPTSGPLGVPWWAWGVGGLAVAGGVAWWLSS